MIRQYDQLRVDIRSSQAEAVALQIAEMWVGKAPVSRGHMAVIRATGN